jgi:sterol desaturase/sphingolipid hydroxylase (fatty acid hydroxylase superfamily)
VLKARHHVAHGVFDVETEVLEVVLLAVLWCAALSSQQWDVEGSSMRLRDVLFMVTAQSLTKRLYTAYLEWAYDAFPEKRTQKAQKRKDTLDSTGRTYEEVALVAWHDRFTLLSGLALSIATYELLGARLYPEAPASSPAFWAAQCLAQDLTLSFGMYWAHRNLHANKFLWRHIHS